MSKKRIFASISGNLFAQGSNIVIQIIGIPILLFYWGIEYYGEWILIFTIPGYIGMSEIGLGTTVSSEMSMLVANGEREKAQNLLRTTFWIILTFGLIPVLLLILSNFIFSWYGLLGLSQISENDFIVVFIILTIYVYLSLFLTLPLGYYRVEMAYHKERIISTLFKIVEFLFFLISVMLGMKMVSAALIFFAVRLVYFLYVYYDLRKNYKWFNIFPINLDYKKIKYLIKPSISTMVLSLGQNLLSQGMSTIIGIRMGPTILVAFNTTRTLLNATKQLFGIINLSFWTEYSFAFGLKDFSLLKNLFMKAKLINIFLASISCTLLYFFGDWIFNIWTNGNVQVDKMFFVLYLISTFISSIWTSDLALLASINKHTNLARNYVYISFFILVLTSFYAGLYGLFVIGILILTSDLILWYFSNRDIRILLKSSN